MYVSQLLALAFLPSIASGFVVQPPSNSNSITTFPSSTSLQSTEKIMSEIDIMCIANTAELCSAFDECDIEEREAILNRLEEQTDTLAERLAMMQALTRHLKQGDGHAYPSEQEIEAAKGEILSLVNKDLEVVSP
jgi:hypothetical protein